MSSIPQTTVVNDSVSFSKEHLVELCNTYECKVTIGNLTFPSAEHAYACLQHVQGNYEDWCIGGKFADWDYVLGIRSEHETKDHRWREKKLIGGLAGYVIDHPKTFGIKLKPKDNLATSKERWFPIFHAKFQGELKSKLLSTSGLLVQHNEKAREVPWKWGGTVHNGVLYGQNIMGYLLTEFRDMIRPKEVLEVVHKSTLEVIDEKFKKAKDEGQIVDLSDTPGTKRPLEIQMPPRKKAKVPILSTVENSVVTFAGSIESDSTGQTHGRKRRGFTLKDLINIAQLFPGKATIYKVPGGPDANVLVLRGMGRGFRFNHEACFKEITSVPDAYVDKHTWMFGKCREKKSRVNTNYADTQQVGAMDHPDPSKRVPSLLKFGKHLQNIRNLLTSIGHETGVDTKHLYGEVNHYLKSKTLQGIGEHMDKERNLVVGLCLGTTWRNIAFQAYEGAIPIGPKLIIDLHPGDMYFMDVNAKGTGSIMKPHVKHHATGGTGSDKYLKRVTQARARKLKGRDGLNQFAQAIVDGKEIFTDGNPTYL